MKAGSFGIAVVLLVWVSWTQPGGVSAQMMCPVNNNNNEGSDGAALDGVFEVEEQGGTLGPFLSSAGSTRRVVVDGELPYDAIRQEIAKQ